MSLKSRKSQSSIIDFTIAFIIFLIVFIINYYSWTSIQNKIQNDEDYHYFQTSIHQAINSLIKNPGYPINWESNSSTAKSIGLALKPNVLSNEKLNALNQYAQHSLKANQTSKTSNEATQENHQE